MHTWCETKQTVHLDGVLVIWVSSHHKSTMAFAIGDAVWREIDGQRFSATVVLISEVPLMTKKGPSLTGLVPEG